MGTLADLARGLKRPKAARHLPRLLLMTDEVRLPDPVPAIDRLPRRISAVIFRHYGAADRMVRARMVQAACRRRGIVFLVAGDWRLALRLGADGVHLPEYLARRRSAVGKWRRPRRGFLVTASVHCLEGIARVKGCGPDAVIASPVFPTASHPGAATLGVAGLRRIVGQTALPVYAMGGIDGASGSGVRYLGLAGFAGISGLT